MDCWFRGIGKMDYKGQQLSENIYYVLCILCGAIAWVVGFIQGDFSLTVYGWAVGLGLSLLICIPDWPFFNRHPVQWLEEIQGAPKETKKKKDKGGGKNKSKDT